MFLNGMGTKARIALFPKVVTGSEWYNYKYQELTREQPTEEKRHKINHTKTVFTYRQERINPTYQNEPVKCKNYAIIDISGLKHSYQ